MSDFAPRDPDYEARVRASFERQRVMGLIGARLARVEPGRVEIELPWRKDGTTTRCAWGSQTLICMADRPDGPRR